MVPLQVNGTQLMEMMAVSGQFTQTVQVTDEAPRGRWDTTTSSGEIILDADSYFTVYQGEDDIDAWRDTDNSEITGRLLEGEAVPVMERF